MKVWRLLVQNFTLSVCHYFLDFVILLFMLAHLFPPNIYQLHVRQWMIPLTIPRWLSGKESGCRCRKLRFDPQVRKIPWRRKWQPTPVFLPRESYGQRSLVGYNPWGCKESDMTQQLNNNKPFMTIALEFHNLRENLNPSFSSVIG